FLADMQHRPGLAATLHSRWQWVAASLLLIVAIFAAGYHWGLPWLARWIAPAVPDSVVRSLSETTLQALDQHRLKPSRLTATRQSELQAGFARLVAGDPALQTARLLFRSAPTEAPNAFALPDGTVVLFDELLPLARRDDEILAVLTHELGHVHHRHGIRQGIQSSLLAVGAAALLGEVSTWATMVSTLVLTSAYSREMEEESDDYAVARFRQLKLPLDALPAILVTLDAARRKADGDAPPEDSRGALFSSHP
ncbi:MAG TPA: M48 family metallopeptidase, partial [Rhodocyclaceae bacterium]|nr:M48 family metallopeptidase [Rhodocyclaceae bacterium]